MFKNLQGELHEAAARDTLGSNFRTLLLEAKMHEHSNVEILSGGRTVTQLDYGFHWVPPAHGEADLSAVQKEFLRHLVLVEMKHFCDDVVSHHAAAQLEWGELAINGQEIWDSRRERLLFRPPYTASLVDEEKKPVGLGHLRQPPGGVIRIVYAGGFDKAALTLLEAKGILPLMETPRGIVRASEPTSQLTPIPSSPATTDRLLQLCLQYARQWKRAK
jgi:hypothetical protein